MFVIFKVMVPFEPVDSGILWYAFYSGMKRPLSKEYYGPAQITTCSDSENAEKFSTSPQAHAKATELGPEWQIGEISYE